MKPYNFQWTKFYQSNSDFSHSELELKWAEDELVICSTIIDPENYSVLTTQRLITKQHGFNNIGNIEAAKDLSYGDFKGYNSDLFTIGQIELQNGDYLNYFIETGKASMIMIHGIRTLIKIQEMTSNQVDNVTRIWNSQNEK